MRKKNEFYIIFNKINSSVCFFKLILKNKNLNNKSLFLLSLTKYLKELKLNFTNKKKTELNFARKIIKVKEKRFNYLKKNIFNNFRHIFYKLNLKNKITMLILEKFRGFSLMFFNFNLLIFLSKIKQKNKMKIFSNSLKTKMRKKYK